MMKTRHESYVVVREAGMYVTCSHSFITSGDVDYLLVKSSLPMHIIVITYGSYVIMRGLYINIFMLQGVLKIKNNSGGI